MESKAEWCFGLSLDGVEGTDPWARNIKVVYVRRKMQYCLHVDQVWAKYLGFKVKKDELLLPV